MRHRRVAELVAAELRERILSGEVADGGMLPKQEDLAGDFGVSLTSVREALRILETEGLVTVLRGKLGGAVAHRPRPAKVAYMLALVLQSESVPLTDVARALRELEPVCVAMAAARADRGRRVVPRLERVLEASRAAIDDADEYVRLARLFHEELVAGCDCETIVHLVGSLERLWSAHVEGMARRVAQLGEFADRKARVASLRDHERLVKMIAAGQAAAAEQLARRHFAEPERHAFVTKGVTVRAGLLTDA